MKTWCVICVFSIVILGGSTAALAQQAPAGQSLLPSEQFNKGLPRWLRFGGEYRARAEAYTGGAYKPDSEDGYLLNRVRLNMGIQPYPWMKFMFQGQDARAFGVNQKPRGAPYQDTFELRMAYVELGTTEGGSFGLRVGRQEFFFGEQRLVGRSNWANTGRGFDAARLTLRHKGYRLDAIASTVVNVRNAKFNESSPGNNFYVLYGGLERLVPKATLEPFLLWRLAPAQRTELGLPGNLDSKTAGLRWVGKLPRNFDYGTEVALQRGSLAGDAIGAWAGHWLVGHRLVKVRYAPRLIAEYNFGSGDRDPVDGHRGTFDQLYASNHDAYGLGDLVGWKNMHHVKGGVELKVHPKWTVIPAYDHFWLASVRDGLYTAAGALVARKADGSAGRDIGHELDIQALCAVSKYMQFAVAYSRLIPGGFLQRTTPGVAYNGFYSFVNTRF